MNRYKTLDQHGFNFVTLANLGWVGALTPRSDGIKPFQKNKKLFVLKKRIFAPIISLLKQKKWKESTKKCTSCFTNVPAA